MYYAPEAAGLPVPMHRDILPGCLRRMKSERGGEHSSLGPVLVTTRDQFLRRCSLRKPLWRERVSPDRDKTLLNFAIFIYHNLE